MLSEYQIDFLNRVCPDSWTECNDTVNVNGGVNMNAMGLTQIPVQFGTVIGNFYCCQNKLTTLKGAPCKMQEYFNCDSNLLTTLEGGPKEVYGYYSCERNQLTSLIGAPEICNGNFWCQSNQLTSLEGCPRSIIGKLECVNNPNLYVLYGLGRVEGQLYHDRDINNDLNIWIQEQARKNIFLSYSDISKWIKDNNRLEFLLNAQKEIRQKFSTYIIKSVELNLC